MYLMDCALSLLCWPAHKAVIGFHDFVLYLNRAKVMCAQKDVNKDLLKT
jgi:hypothetical protein